MRISTKAEIQRNFNFILAVNQSKNLVSDLVSQSLHHGEFQRLNADKTECKTLEFGNILDQKIVGRKKNENDIMVADLGGLATKDIVIFGRILFGNKHNKEYNEKF